VTSEIRSPDGRTGSPFPPDPRIAILCSAAIAAAASFSGFARLGGLAALCLVLQAAYRVPFPALLRRLAPVVPLILFLGATVLLVPAGPDGPPGGTRAALIAGRTLIVLWSLALLSAAIPFTGIVRGLSGLGIPRLFSSILFFAARYERLLLREAARTRDAVILRSAGNRRALKRKAVISRLAFRPVERAFERSDRIHAAMLARGWNGRFPVLRLRGPAASDFAFAIAVAGWIAAVLEVWK